MAGVSQGGTIGEGALLLADSWGEKGGSWINLKKKKEQFVMKGTLLLAIPEKNASPRNDGKPGHNFHVFKNDISLYCPEENITPLTNYEFQLLGGMKTCTARYQAFLDGILEWGCKLKVNDVVYVALPSKQVIPNTARCQAEIRWLGTLPDEEGIKFGLEITVA